jgi:hypothetical protein
VHCGCVGERGAAAAAAWWRRRQRIRLCLLLHCHCLEWLCFLLHCYCGLERRLLLQGRLLLRGLLLLRHPGCAQRRRRCLLLLVRWLCLLCLLLLRWLCLLLLQHAAAVWLLRRRRRVGAEA